MDNNRTERSIKPFVIGRKKWLFRNPAKGARSSAIIYSVVEPSKEKGVNPFNYLSLAICLIKNRFSEEKIKDFLERWWDLPIETINANIDFILNGDAEKLKQNVRNK